VYYLIAWRGGENVPVHMEKYFTEQSYVRWLNENKNAYDNFKVIKGYEVEVFLL